MNAPQFHPQLAAPQDLSPRIAAAIRALPLSQGWCGQSLPQCPALLWPWPGSPRRLERPWRNRFVGVPAATLAKVGLRDQRVLGAPGIRARTLMDLQAAILADIEEEYLPGGVGPYLIQAPSVRWRPEASWRLMAWMLLLAALEPPEAVARAFAEGEAALPLSVRIPRAHAWDLVGDHSAPRSAPLDCLSPHAQPRMILFSRNPSSETSVPVTVFSYFTQFFQVGRAHAGREVEEAEIGLSREGAAWAWALRVKLLRLVPEENLAAFVAWWERLTGPEARLVLHLLLTPGPGPATHIQTRGILPAVLGRTAIGPHAARTCTEAWTMVEEFLDGDLQDAPDKVREWILGALPPPPSPRGGNRQNGETPQKPTDILVTSTRQNGEVDEVATDILVTPNRHSGEANRHSGEASRHSGEGENPKYSNGTTCHSVPPVNRGNSTEYRTSICLPSRTHATHPQTTEAGGRAGTHPAEEVAQGPTTITGASEAVRTRLEALGLLGGVHDQSEALGGILERLAGLQGDNGIPVGKAVVQRVLGTTPWSDRGLRVVCEALARTRGVRSMRCLLGKVLGGDLGQKGGGPLPAVDEILALAERHQAAGWVGFPVPRRRTPLVTLPEIPTPSITPTTRPEPEDRPDADAEFRRRHDEALAQDPVTMEVLYYEMLAATRNAMIEDGERIDSPFWDAVALSRFKDVNDKHFVAEIDPGPGIVWVRDVQETFDASYATRVMMATGSTRSIHFVPSGDVTKVASF